MARYHINPKTGNPGICTANAGRCPYGGEEEHYGSADVARSAFESGMNGSFGGAQPTIKIQEKDESVIANPTEWDQPVDLNAIKSNVKKLFSREGLTGFYEDSTGNSMETTVQNAVERAAIASEYFKKTERAQRISKVIDSHSSPASREVAERTMSALNEAKIQRVNSGENVLSHSNPAAQAALSAAAPYVAQALAEADARKLMRYNSIMAAAKKMDDDY